MCEEIIAISVVLPVYNAETTIWEAINSILNQSFKDFELIVINDGCTDKSEEIILSFKDDRIKYFSNESNKGLIYTLNKGLKISQGKYFARMDADDISLSTRLEKQFEIMENNPGIIVCGTCIEAFGCDKARKFKFIAEEKSEIIKKKLFKESPIAHPTAMIRRQVLQESQIEYNKEYPHAEDYKLWIDLADFGDFYNLQENLLKYRLSDTQITRKWNDIQMETSRKCRQEYIIKMLINSEIVANLKKGNIDRRLIKEFKKESDSREVLEVFYMSLNKYSFKELFFFIFSSDCFKFKLSTTLAILKRFVKGRNPVI